MPVKPIVAIVLARKLYILVAALTLGLLLYVGIFLPKPSDGLLTKIGNTRYQLEQATTSEQRALGLSGRDGLSYNSGMLFSFVPDESTCMWMKDMKFAIDIIWLDERKQVITMQPNVTPDTYPQAFCPDTVARYVIELPAGSIERNDIRLKQNVQF